MTPSEAVQPPQEARCLACRAFAPLGELLRVEHVRTGGASFVHRPGYGRPFGEPCVRSVGSAAVYRLSLAAPPSGRPAMHPLEDRWLAEDAERAARIAAEHRPTADQW